MHRQALISLIGAVLLAPLLSGQAGVARYELTFTSTWSAATHPVDFPGNPHFSPLVGGTHDSGVSFWQPGGIASDGMEIMAETGGTGTLVQEVESAINAGSADQSLLGPGMNSPDSTSLQFEVQAAHSLLTMVSMLAPSPDWFVGVSGLELMPNGVWVDELSIELALWDAGTDSGSTYLSANANIQNRLPIQLVTRASGPFQNASLLVGSYHLKRLWSGLVYGCGVNPSGSMSFRGESRIGEKITLAVDDPGGFMPMPSATALALANNPWQDFPCGFPLLGLGMDPAQPGEVLVNGIYRSFLGNDWFGAEVDISITIPNDQNLIGRRFYLQGVMVGGGRIGVADAVELLVGN